MTHSTIHNLLTKGVSRVFLIIALILLIPVSIFAAENSLKKSDACLLEDGEYDLYSGDVSGYTSLEAFWSKGKIAKVVGFLKKNNFLYYGVTVYAEGDTFSDSYLYEYSCLKKSAKKLTYLFRQKGDNGKNIASFFAFIDESKRYYLIWGGILGGGGGNWGVYDLKNEKYYDLFFWNSYRIRNLQCGDDSGPSGCFQEIQETNGVLNIQMLRDGRTEEVDKYSIDFKNKKLINF